MVERSTTTGFDQTVKEFRSKMAKKRGRDMTDEEIEQSLAINPIPGLNLSPLA